MSRTGDYYLEKKQESSEQRLYGYAFDSHLKSGEHENPDPDGELTCDICFWLQDVGYLADYDYVIQDEEENA